MDDAAELVTLLREKPERRVEAGLIDQPVPPERRTVTGLNIHVSAKDAILRVVEPTLLGGRASCAPCSHPATGALRRILVELDLHPKAVADEAVARLLVEL